MSTPIPSSPSPKLPAGPPAGPPAGLPIQKDAVRPAAAPAVEPSARAAPVRPTDHFVAQPPQPAAGAPLQSQPVLRRDSAAALGNPAFSPEHCRPPRDLILPWDLRGKGAPTEESLLKLNGGRGALFAVGDWKPGAKPLVLVHGISADFADLQPIIDKFKNDPNRQVLVYAYDDNNTYTGDNGVQLGRELKALRERYPWTDSLDVVGHSMGGIIARRGINELAAGPTGGIDRFEKIRFLAVDTPWHGFPGPGWRLDIFKGAMDMQARSGMFQGHQGAQDQATGQGVVGVPLPRKVEVQIVSADNTAGGGKPDSILDYTDHGTNHFGADLARLPEALRRYLRANPQERSSGAWAKDLDVYAKNYLSALTADKDWPRAERELGDLLDQEKLDPQCIARVLARHMPRYGGEHTGVLSNPDFLRDLPKLLD